MKSRAELEEILAAQRANRRTPAPAPRGKGRNLVGVLAVIVILIASGAAMFFAVQWTTPKLDATATTSFSASPSASASTNTTSTSLATPAARLVCTGIPGGRLHVRFAAGDGSEVRGYLAEGETVQVAIGSDEETLQGNQWLRISFPIAGWVNARYLCKSEQR
jgi:hypothetical protein